MRIKAVHLYYWTRHNDPDKRNRMVVVIKPKTQNVADIKLQIGNVLRKIRPVGPDPEMRQHKKGLTYYVVVAMTKTTGEVTFRTLIKSTLL